MAEGADELARILHDLEANMDPAEKADTRRRLDRLMNAGERLGGVLTAVHILQAAMDMTGELRFEEALDRILDTLEHA